MSDPLILQGLHEEIASGYAALAGLHRAVSRLRADDQEDSAHKRQAVILEQEAHRWADQHHAINRRREAA